MAAYDLTMKMVPFFDLHLVIPFLEFIGPRKVLSSLNCYYIISIFRFTMKNPSLMLQIIYY